jgi:hypothetical protein
MEGLSGSSRLASRHHAAIVLVSSFSAIIGSILFSPTRADAARPFADDILVAHNTAEEPVNMRIRNALPDLRETVRSTREVVLSRVDLRSAKINRTLEEGFSRVNDGLNALRTSIPEQLLMTSRYPPLASFVPRCRSSPCGSHHII